LIGKSLFIESGTHGAANHHTASLGHAALHRANDEMNAMKLTKY
jgi:hypothetical protein